jgi:hypothetical protein
MAKIATYTEFSPLGLNSCKLCVGTTLLMLLAIVINPNTISAQIAGGGYAESYLLRNVNARPISMAGAYTAIANDPSAIYYNPAGLASLTDRPNFSSMYTFLEYGRTHSSLAWGQNMMEDFGFGFGINNFTSGSFMARDIKGNPLGDRTAWQFSATAAGAYTLEFFSVGASLKYLSNSLESSGVRADGFGLDLGTKFNVMDLFTVGVSMQNIASMMFWNTESEESNLLPYTVRAGVAMEFGLNENIYITRSTVSGELEEVYEPATRYILVGVDAVLTQHENGPTVVLGVEAVPHEVIAFRGGLSVLGDDMNEYELFPMTIWGGGVSIRPDMEDFDLPFKMTIDYSISSDWLAKNRIAHTVSLNVELE